MRQIKYIRGKEIKRGRIFKADIDGGFGSEQDGFRYVLIIQNDIGNEYSPTTIVAMLTTRVKKELPTHSKIKKYKELGLNRKSIILLEQIRTIDKRRLKEYVAELPEEMMRQVENCINISLGMPGSNFD